MPSPTDLTSRLAHLRDRNENATPEESDQKRPDSPKTGRDNRRLERKLADDFFMLFVYALLGVAMISQLVLIIALDVL